MGTGAVRATGDGRSGQLPDIPIVSEASPLIRHCGFARYSKNSLLSCLQTRYDLEVAEDEIAAKVVRDVQPLESVTVPDA
jgi:hypothetical protein